VVNLQATEAKETARHPTPHEQIGDGCWLKESLTGFILSTLFDFQSHQGNSQ